MRETRPIPKIALSAFGLLAEQQKQGRQLLVDQTAELMALGPTEGWAFDLQAGVASREVPDPDVIGTIGAAVETSPESAPVAG